MIEHAAWGFAFFCAIVVIADLILDPPKFPRLRHWASDPTDPWGHDQENCDRCRQRETYGEFAARVRSGDHDPDECGYCQRGECGRREECPCVEVPESPNMSISATRITASMMPYYPAIIFSHIHDGDITSSPINEVPFILGKDRIFEIPNPDKVVASDGANEFRAAPEGSGEARAAEQACDNGNFASLFRKAGPSA